ncbi:FecR family protein [Hephaestia mangrovi]|uniref:FecR family protein n=1 Tax=Hephaestia mangrovi TaxID=2873268 RepID=UPI001CA7482D|nr:FecR domain-containing protein [Hephaestia mangrovi]MBY8828849.1 FecR domain-containing protein [Hephaestia mangrovi]
MNRQEAIEDRALEWLIRRNSPDWSDNEQSEFDAWLEESMAHKAAFWRADHGWQQADRIRSLGFGNEDWPIENSPQRSWRKMAAIAASLLAIVAVGGPAVIPHLGMTQQTSMEVAHFATPTGARKIVNLTDGSMVELNTQTTLRTGLSENSRKVWLDSGEAFFDVVHDAKAPFVVYAGQQTITDLGTKFSVRREGDRVTVNVLEGKVQVQDSQGPEAHAAIITAGDTAISRGPSTLIVPKSTERVQNALAWRDGLLDYDQAPLSTVVADFNRYNQTQIVVTDASAGRILIGGSFKASSVDSFTRLLRDAYGLKVERDGNRVIISSS